MCSSHRRRQLTGINPGKSHGQGPWVSHERHRLDDSSSANRRRRSCSILLFGDAITGKAKASAHKARVTDCVLVELDVSPASPITGKAKASAHKARVTDCVLVELDVSPAS